MLCVSDRFKGAKEGGKGYTHSSSIFGSDLAVMRYCLSRYSCALSAYAPTE